MGFWDRAKYSLDHSLNKEIKMRLNAPKKVTWWVAVVVGLVGLLGKIITIPFVSAIAFWLVFVAFVLLALGTYLKGF